MTYTSQPASKQLYLGSVSDLKSTATQDLALWSCFYDRIVSHNVPLVDRSQRVTMPYAFKLWPAFAMPTDITGALTYAECCEARASDLLNLSRTLNKPIVFFYSGGIDSTIVAISFLRAASSSELRDRVTVAMSPDSIAENPSFYYQHVRPNFRLTSSEYFGQLFATDSIIVGGEHNDQLFGSDIVGKIETAYGFARVLEPYTQGLLRDWFLRNGMTPAQATFWFDLLVDHAEASPCEIKTSFDLLWWLNFNFKWQSVFFRMLLRVGPEYQQGITEAWTQQQFHHFFSDTRFQVWSMANPQLKIKDSWASYKYHAKEMIYDYTRDWIYKTDKLKRGSLYKLFLSRRTPVGLTSDFEFLYSLDPQSLRVEANTFRLDESR